MGRRENQRRKRYRKKKRLNRQTIRKRNLRRISMIRFYPFVKSKKEETYVENYSFAAAEI